LQIANGKLQIMVELLATGNWQPATNVILSAAKNL